VKLKLYSSKVMSLQQLKGGISEAAVIQRYVGAHMTTDKLQVGCLPSCRRSWHRNNTSKI